MSQARSRSLPIADPMLGAVADISQRYAGRTRPNHLFDETPFIAFWETTRACDLACKHCRASAVKERDANELSTEEGFALIDALATLRTPILILTGGDPAKRPDLPEFIRYGTSRGIRVGLTPSATPLVTHDWLRELRDAGLARLAVSLDGATAATHDGFRGVAGSFEKTFEILRDAKSLGLTTQINTSVTRASVDEFPRIAEQIRELGIELWSVFFVVPTGRAKPDDVVEASEVEAVLQQLAELSTRVPFDIKTTAAPHFRRVLLQHKTPRHEIVGIGDGIGRASRSVNDGSGVVFISHDGDIFPSGFLPLPCGNVRRDDLVDVYRNHLVFRALRDPDVFQGKCGECEYRKVCGGSRARAFAMTGDALESDPACVYLPRGWT